MYIKIVNVVLKKKSILCKQLILIFFYQNVGLLFFVNKKLQLNTLHHKLHLKKTISFSENKQVTTDAKNK